MPPLIPDMPSSDASRPPQGQPIPSVMVGLSLEALPGAVAVSQHGAYLQVNTAFLRLFGHAEASEIFGRPLLDHIAQPQRDLVRARNQEREGIGSGPLEYETQGLRKDGSTFPLRIHASTVHLADGAGTLIFLSDLSERRRTEELFEKRIVTLTQPMNGNAISFEELFSLTEFQRIQDEFALATGVASIITHPDGTPITAPSNFTYLCSEIIRKTELGSSNCFKSDAALGRYHPAAPIVQPCGSGGLWDAGASITVGGHHIANWLIGQVRDESQSEEAMRAYAREIGADEVAFLEAFQKVPAMTRQQFERIARFLFSLANRLSTAAYQNVLQARSIAERKRTEDALRESEQQLQVIFETSEAGILLISPQGRIQYANRRMAEMFGMPMKALIGSPYTGHLHESSKQAGQERLIQILAGEVQSTSSERRYLRADGTDFWGQLSGRRLENSDGSLRALVGVVTDISAHKQAVEALRLSEDRLRLTLDATRIGSWDWDLRNDTWYASPIYYEMLGYEAETGAPDRTLWLNRVHPDDKEFVKEKIDAVIAKTTTNYTYEARFLHADGSYRWIQNIGFVVESDASGKPTRMVGIRKDATEGKQAEEQQQFLQAQLHQAQKMESLGSLAGGVAHDMNNVLGAIMGLASAHIEAQPPGSPIQRALGTIIKAAERGGNMLKSLLSFARQNSAEVQELDLNAILREEVRLLERTTLSKVRLVMDLASDLWLIRGDAGALTHAFMNLCVNAVDAMPENGTLTLRTRNLERDWVEVQVQDTGTGMPQEILEKALDPFFTTKEVGKGTGLGLPIVYSTVKSHQGRMELRSEPGRGTCVILRFPACAVSPRIAEPSGTYRTMPHLGTLKVLLVDDDELIQSSMQGILELLGHEVTVVPSGEEALARLQAGLKPGVVILDMNMPGLGGAGTLPRLRALLPSVPVLLATGRADQNVQNLVQAYPFVTLLSKPFGMKELQAHLAPYVG